MYMLGFDGYSQLEKLFCWVAIVLFYFVLENLLSDL